MCKALWSKSYVFAAEIFLLHRTEIPTLILFFLLTCFMKEVNMSTGTVKWFNTKKGYGFIQPDDGSADVFVHISAVEQAGMRSLYENDKVSYEIVTDRGRSSAGNLEKL